MLRDRLLRLTKQRNFWHSSGSCSSTRVWLQVLPDACEVIVTTMLPLWCSSIVIAGARKSTTMWNALTSDLIHCPNRGCPCWNSFVFTVHRRGDQQRAVLKLNRASSHAWLSHNRNYETFAGEEEGGDLKRNRLLALVTYNTRARTGLFWKRE